MGREQQIDLSVKYLLCALVGMQVSICFLHFVMLFNITETKTWPCVIFTTDMFVLVAVNTTQLQLHAQPIEVAPA